MKKTKLNKFSKKSLDFLVKAGKQKHPDWLEKNKIEYEEVLKIPFITLAKEIKAKLKPLAPSYHFPSTGLARIKRPEFKVLGGQPQFKDWISMIASKPSATRFESNPHLFFGLFPNEKQKILLAGGLWQPTSNQTRKIRHAISQDSEPFHQLFKDSKFKSSFKKGFSLDNQAIRTPKGFSEDQPDLEWIRLKNFVVMKEFSITQFSSPKFSDLVIADFTQALRLNKLLENALMSRM